MTPERDAKIRRMIAQRQTGVVVLEDIYDPHNAAAVFRSCDAMGIDRVCLIFDQQKPFNPAKLGHSTASSANKWLTFETYHSTEACLNTLKQQGYTLFATALNDAAVSVFETDLTTPHPALLFGNEHRGLSETACEMADHTVLIPMAGMVQSLNLSVTAGMLLFELRRQRQAAMGNGGGESFALSPTETTALEARFLKPVTLGTSSTIPTVWGRK